MTKKINLPKIALDTNVLLAAFVARGLCADLLALLLRRQIDGSAQVLVSQPVEQEFTRHLQGKFKASRAQCDAALDALRAFGKNTKPSSNSPVDLSAVPDADDVPVLAAALQWQATHCITGDKALHPLTPLHGMHILTPRQAFTEFHA